MFKMHSYFDNLLQYIKMFAQLTTYNIKIQLTGTETQTHMSNITVEYKHILLHIHSRRYSSFQPFGTAQHTFNFYPRTSFSAASHRSADHKALHRMPRVALSVIACFQASNIWYITSFLPSKV